MINSYFEYALINCRTHVITSVCERYQLKEKLIESVNKEWGEYKGITYDRNMLLSIQSLFEPEGVLDEGCYSGDSLILFDRCVSVYSSIRESLRKDKLVDYDSLFNSLVDICWLVASVYNSNMKNDKYVILLSNQKDIRDSAKSFLESVYVKAIQNHNEMVYITEAINAKKEHPLFTGLYDNQFEESEYYIQSNMTQKELLHIKNMHKSDCRTNLSMYYCLTATAVLAENIRRLG